MLNLRMQKEDIILKLIFIGGAADAAPLTLSDEVRKIYNFRRFSALMEFLRQRDHFSSNHQYIQKQFLAELGIEDETVQ